MGRRLVAPWVVLLTTLPLVARASPQSSASMLVEQGMKAESDGDDLTALRRYGDALDIDPTAEAAYLALVGLRARRGELLEAEEVGAAGISRVPGSVDLHIARAAVRRRRGRPDDARDDLRRAQSMNGRNGAPREVLILRELASLERAARAPAAELAIWRRLLVVGRDKNDLALQTEALTQTRALTLYVGDLDPVVRGRSASDSARRTLAAIARRGG